MTKNTITTDEHGMFMSRERVEEYFLLKGQIALITKAIYKSYDEASESYKNFTSVRCSDLAEILGIKLANDEELPFE